MRAKAADRSAAAPAHGTPELETGHAAYREQNWSDAHRLLSRAAQSEALCAEDLECLATSAYLAGHEADFHRHLDRAYREHANHRNPQRAARCAFWLGLVLLLRGRAAQASGWLARAQRGIEGLDCVEQGYLLLPVAEQRLNEGDAVAAYAHADRAAAMGERYADIDLASCARHLQGRARIRQGRVREGLSLLDEAMLAVVAGELSPIMTGLVYCSVIDACQQVQASNRAREWTEALGSWCDRQTGLAAFTGTCLVHRAEILQMHGSWREAMTEAQRACRQAAEAADRTPPAAALYRQAELHRLRGDFTAADDAYRAAAELGFEVQPGLALLRLAQGNAEAARAGIRRALGEAKDPFQRAKLLPGQAEIALHAADPNEARAACIELERIAHRLDTEVLAAGAAQWLGALELAEGHARAAIACLRRAFELWRTLEAPYEAARVRALIGQACRALGDHEAARTELLAAKAVFEALGAAPALARLEPLLQPVPRPRSSPLTPREQEVLRLIASGKTNRAIAARFALSERTVDRHVANILVKLDVPSRAAAIAVAFDRKLL